MTRRIGITGGIGMGKTTVSNYLAAAHRLPILDADLIARDAVAPGSPILAQIIDRYGAHLLRIDGTLDRAKLGTIVFSNPTERIWLEQQIHPYVRQMLEAECDRLAQTHPTIVLVIPLLFEANMTDLVSEIWVICCSESQQIQRLMQREKLSLEQAQARIQSQMPIKQKRDRANVILDNSTTPEALMRQVDRALSPTS
ncbi:dephospho-CoA kinase [Cyanobacteria bacterium FACHB-DQ100]|uniref:dephospho-CoA kinase n=1 Tax=Leptolyngbya sp. DQ-M1 TaxID=2933920 RepID=UPI0019A0083C|nr:dephospho-CoA kinase [Cyanobacteria bacterium FACHB-DQ100]